MRLAGARLVDERDYPAVRAALASDPIASCMVSSRVESLGLDPFRLGGELWALESRYHRHTRLPGLCFAGANLIPLRGDTGALQSFADRALRGPRRCSSIVGPATQVLGLWDELASDWGPARELRCQQPLLALDRAPAVPCDTRVRRVRPHEIDRYYPAAVAMFTEEVGVDPRLGDGGASYHARVSELIAGGRAFARFEDGEVVFKAEIGALSATVGQIQGVWVHPERRSGGLGSAGTATVAATLIHDLGRTASLYVNSFNAPALAAYRKIGFTKVGEFATVLF
ncbi:GNAT family N-acetyltransferase [Haloechinothrix salitolerans]